MLALMSCAGISEEAPSATVSEFMAQKDAVEAELRALADEQAVWDGEAACWTGCALQTECVCQRAGAGQNNVG